jgi:hypothetical protein
LIKCRSIDCIKNAIKFIVIPLLICLFRFKALYLLKENCAETRGVGKMLEIMALYNIPAGEVACSSGHLLAYHLHYRQMNGKAKEQRC